MSRSARVLSGLLAVIVLGAVAGCGGGGEGSEAAADGRLRVAAGFYPLAFAAEEIGRHGVDVENLTPPGVEPHDLELSARDVERIQSADLVLYLGSGFQPAVEDAALRSTGPVDLLDTLDLIEGGDPHVWLDPVRYAEIAARLGRMLQAEEAAAGFSARLAELDRELEEGLADCERRTIVTSHEAFGYLADRYGLEQIGVTGIEPEAEPAPQDLADVVDAVRETGATTVFVETLVSPEIAETVAREAGATVAILDPLEGLSEGALAEGSDYFSVMRENLAALREALGCR
jgi:zinc transport system substrate-binding protein